MAISDSVANALTVIRNGFRSNKDRVDIPASKMMAEILKVLKSSKFIYDFRAIDDKKQGIIRVYLRKQGEATRGINQIVKVSRPGLRRYTGSAEIPTVLNGFGICIVSTPQGILLGDDAKKRNVGGELICKVW